MNTHSRTIAYANSEEDVLQKEVDVALAQPMEKHLQIYCYIVRFNFALMGIDVSTYKVKRTIAYADEP